MVNLIRYGKFDTVKSIKKDNLDHFRAYFSHFRALKWSKLSVLYWIYQKSIQNGHFPSYIDIFYRNNRLISTVFGNGKGIGSIWTHDTVKFIKFWMVNIRFEINLILSQDFGWESLAPKRWTKYTTNWALVGVTKSSLRSTSQIAGSSTSTPWQSQPKSPNPLSEAPLETQPTAEQSPVTSPEQPWPLQQTWYVP